jgi:hypothetical protein
MSQMHASRVSVMEECEGLARAGLASPRRSGRANAAGYRSISEYSPRICEPEKRELVSRRNRGR